MRNLLFLSIFFSSLIQAQDSFIEGTDYQIIDDQPSSYVSKKSNNLEIINKVILINKFWKKKFNKKVKIGVTGLNPHCESIDSFNEDKRIILPAIKKLKKAPKMGLFLIRNWINTTS